MARAKSKLRVENNWERLTYFIGDEKLKVDATCAYTAVVLWPNDETSVVDVVSRKVHAEVMDMGHVDRFVDDRLIALVNHKGFVVEVPLEKLHVLRMHKVH